MRFFVRLCGYSAGRRMGRCFTGAGSYTKPGGARSGGQAAGTLRGLRPAGMPPGTRCAPTPRIRGDLRSTGYHAPECRVPVSIRKKRAAKARPACPAAPYMRLTAAAPVPLGCFPHVEPSTGPAPAYGVGADAPAAAPPPPTLPAEGSLFHPPPNSMHSGCTLPPGAPSPAGRCFPVPTKKLFPALLSAGNAPAASMCSCLRIPLLLPRL